MAASVITTANSKGGSGKTTSVLLLSEQLAISGAKVAILDLDPNQNIVIWANQRGEQGKMTPFTVHPRPAEGQVVSTIEQLEDTCRYLLIDTEGTADQLLAQVLVRTDLCIIPFEPTPMEARQAARTAALVNKASRSLSRTIRFTLLFNRTNAAFQTSEERDIRSETNTVPTLPVSLMRRAAYTRIFRDSTLLSELSGAKVSNLNAAIANAHAYAQSVMTHLDARLGVAA